MFVDASALVAILTEEADAETLTKRLNAAQHRFTSAVAIFETLAALSRKTLRDVETLAADLEEFLAESNIEVRPIIEANGWAAAEAHFHLGKRSGHPARLNLGDCFAYAMAKQHGVPLLHNGDDLAHTDLA